MIRIGVQVIGADNAGRTIARVESRARNLEPAYREINARVIEPFFVRQWDTSGRAGGRPWKRLSSRTVRARLRKRGGNRGGTSRPLWDFGALRASFIKPGPQAIVRFGSRIYERGSSVPYGAFHQLGTRYIPARKIVPDKLPKDVIGQIEERIRAHMEREG